MAYLEIFGYKFMFDGLILYTFCPIVLIIANALGSLFEGYLSGYSLKNSWNQVKKIMVYMSVIEMPKGCAIK